MLNPFEIKILNQAEDEHILKVWRRHRITLIIPTLRVMAFVLIPLLIVVFSGLSMFSSPWLFGLFLIIVGIVITYAAYEWATWYGDVYVLTNYRIVDVDQTGFFDRKFAEASISRIQDVSYRIQGIWQTFFDFGNVTVQTAGSLDNICFEEIGDPAEQTKYILKEQEKYLENSKDEMSAEDLIKLLNKHHENLSKLPDLEKKDNLERTRKNLKKAQEQTNKKKSFRKKKKEAEGAE